MRLKSGFLLRHLKSRESQIHALSQTVIIQTSSHDKHSLSLGMTTEQEQQRKEADECWTDSTGRLVSYEHAQRRKCVVCGEMFDWDGAEFKVSCLQCFMNKSRKCASCPGIIPPSAPSWQTNCITCYVDRKRARGFKTCPTCPPSRATHLRCPAHKSQCQDCETRLRVVMQRPESE